MFSSEDHYWMQQAIFLAETAAQKNEVPVGAVLVADNKILGSGFNCPISTCDPTAHAEIVALRQGAQERDNYRLINTTLYVTLEPCIMCIGAIVHARITRLVFGASDQKSGAVVSAFQLLDTTKLNHRVNYGGGLMANICSGILSDFFRQRREEQSRLD